MKAKQQGCRHCLDCIALRFNRCVAGCALQCNPPERERSQTCLEPDRRISPTVLCAGIPRTSPGPQGCNAQRVRDIAAERPTHRRRPRRRRPCPRAVSRPCVSLAAPPATAHPSSSASPPFAVYFMLRERQLNFAIQCANADGTVWLTQSVAGNQPASLLEQRGQAALSIKLLAAPCSGFKRGETAVYVGPAQLPRARRAPPHAAAAAACPGAQKQRTGAVSQPAQQPPKRSRCVPSAPAAHPQWAYQRSASAPAQVALPVLPARPAVVHPMRPAPNGGSSSAVNALSKDAAPQRPSSPLVAWLRRLKGLMSPARQQAIVLAIC